MSASALQLHPERNTRKSAPLLLELPAYPGWVIGALNPAPSPNGISARSPRLRGKPNRYFKELMHGEAA